MLKPAFELRARQQLALTPRLQQSVRLLQLSALEFAQELQQALATNPFLEEEEAYATEEAAAEGEFGTATLALDEAIALPAETTPATSETGEEFSAEGDAASGETLEEYGSYDDHDGPDNHDSHDGDGASHASRNNHDSEDSDVGEWMHSMPTLHEHLHLELRNYRLNERDKALARIVIDALDDDGYLRQDLAELAALVPDDIDLHAPHLGLEDANPLDNASPCDLEAAHALRVEELRIALLLVQQLDPPGIAARNLSECMCLQLEALAPATPGRELARTIVTQHLDKLARRDFAELQRLTQADAEAVRIACNLIRSLDPRPGGRFARDHADYVVPDVLVRKIKGQWTASINPAVLPRTRIHRAYADMFQQARCNNRSPLAQQLQEARWLIRNAEQRFATIHRVAEAIVAHQRTFFEYGEIAMKPLVLRDVAEELGLHESTVSRATGNKYMATPRGIFEFKHFFSRQLATESGGSCSAAAVRALLKEMIEAESADNPLSDVSLTRMLADQGVIVARRTVAKYRGLMKVPAAEMRRQA